MKTSIMIVSYSKHFPWLRQCLRSIEKYVTGFNEVNVCVPDEDAGEMVRLRDECRVSIPTRVTGFPDWEGKGFLRHMDVIMHSDQYCPEADFVFHLDSDCFFLEPVSPEDYFVNGKPVLMYARYEWLGKIEPTILCWQEAAYRALGWTPEMETMRRHGAIHFRDTYLLTRQCIERHTGKLISDYIKEQKNEHPSTFAEFPTLGAYAWRFLSQKYHWVNQEKDPRPRDLMMQGWTHQTDFNAPLEIWHADQKITIIPNEMFAKYL